MTLPMIIALAVTVLMIILIMVDKLPFGAPPLLALLLLVVFGVTDIKTAFGGFANPTIVMLASFMAIIAALQKTSFIVKFKQTMFNMASKGGFKAYVLLILIVMLGCSLFGTGSTAYYVLVIGLLSTLPYSKQLPPSRVLMPAGFAANHPLLPFRKAQALRQTSIWSSSLWSTCACPTASWCGASWPTRSCRITPLPRPRKRLSTPVSRRSP